MDEDVTGAVGTFLTSSHDVRLARDIFGPQTEDRLLVSWARAQGAVLVTADNRLARPLKQSHRCACLHLRDLYTAELDRVRELLPVIEAEHRMLGSNFWMQIGSSQYVVAR